MGKRSLMLYVFVSFLIVWILAYFFQGLMNSPALFIILPIIFRLVIGMTWKDSFSLGFLNSIIFFIIAMFVLTVSIVALIEGANYSGESILYATIISIVGFVVSIIYLNWKGKGRRRLEYSMLDKILDLISKGKFKSGGKHKTKHSWKQQPKTFISYWIAFTIGYFLYTKLLPLILVNNIYAQFIIGGFIIELTAKILQLFLFNRNNIRLDKMFIVWGLIHSANIWVVLKVLEYLNLSISNVYVQFGLVGLGLTIVTHIVWKIWYK